MDVPELVIHGRRYVTDEAKAKVLINTFFPTLPLPEGRDPDRAVRSRAEHDIGRLPLIKNEVERLFLRATPIKY
jgi:hypothetical protein